MLSYPEKHDPVSPPKPARRWRWIGAAVLIGGSLLLWLVIVGGSGMGDDMIFPHDRMILQRADGTQFPVEIEVAVTPEQKQRGLMFRRSLAEDHGMIFVWDEDQPVSMWMKNTYIPLDMLFVRRDGTIVKILSNAEPLNLTPLPSGQPVRAVIELKAGEATRHGLQVGDKVIYAAFGGK